MQPYSLGCPFQTVRFLLDSPVRNIRTCGTFSMLLGIHLTSSGYLCANNLRHLVFEKLDNVLEVSHA